MMSLNVISGIEYVMLLNKILAFIFGLAKVDNL